ncbi:MAG: FAD-dependent oxidoreductase, partial [Ilumatobacter sp.]
MPQLDGLARGGRSAILTALRTRRPPTGEPIFAAPPPGMGSLTDAIASRIVDLGVTMRIGRAVDRIQAVDGGVEIDGERFDAVVLATPARVSARLLETSAPTAA